MNYLVHGGWSTRFKSLSYKPVRDGWDTVTATILHRGDTLSQVRALYPRHLAVPGLGIGFYVSDSDIRPAVRLPGVVVADVQLVGSFEAKIQGTGAASAHSESPTNIKIPALGTATFQKTDILVCEPTFEVFALDTRAPNFDTVGTRVAIAYGSQPLPQPPPNPFNFSAADAVANRTVRWPYGWCHIGVEYERIGTLWLKRYYYTFRHLVTP